MSGNVAWVVAVSSPNHVRLTLLDSGYINPRDKTAIVTFNTVTPVSVTDILTEGRIPISNKTSARVTIPCGLFRFIDIEIEESL